MMNSLPAPSQPAPATAQSALQPSAPQPSAAANSPRRDWPATLLTGLALLVGGLLAAQLSQLLSGAPAVADLVAANSEFTLLTTDAGNSEDVALVLDQRGETLLLYRCLNQRSIEFLGRTDLRELFFTAKRSGK